MRRTAGESLPKAWAVSPSGNVKQAHCGVVWRTVSTTRAGEAEVTEVEPAGFEERFAEAGWSLLVDHYREDPDPAKSEEGPDGLPRGYTRWCEAQIESEAGRVAPRLEDDPMIRDPLLAKGGGKRRRYVPDALLPASVLALRERIGAPGRDLFAEVEDL